MMITDRKHLHKVVREGLAALMDLEELWLEEDRGAYSPRSSADGPSGSGTPDPTGGIADDRHKTRDRDAIGGHLVRVVQSMQKEIERRKTRTPTRRCNCCHDTMATHGPLCWDCDRYHRKMGYRCTDDIHDGRPKIRMCECPTDCCDVCPDRAAEGRTISERCKKRMRDRPDRRAHTA